MSDSEALCLYYLLRVVVLFRNLECGQIPLFGVSNIHRNTKTHRENPAKLDPSIECIGTIRGSCDSRKELDCLLRIDWYSQALLVHVREMQCWSRRTLIRS